MKLETVKRALYFGCRGANKAPETARENAPIAFRYACESYPWVIARQRHPLVLQPK